jgi:predicted phage replisome organizer
VNTRRFFWFKLKNTFFDSDDMRLIEGQENGAQYIIFWQKLLLRAIDQVKPGLLRYKEDIPYDDKILSTVTKTDIDIVRSAIKLFTQLKMIEMRSNGDIWVPEIEDLVGSETSWAKYKRIERRKPRLLDNVQDVSKKVQAEKRREEKSKEEGNARPSASLPASEKGKRAKNEYPPDFETFWASYPLKKEKRGALKAWKARLKEGIEPADLIAAGRAYAAECERKRTAPDYIKHPATFLGPNEPWRDYIGTPADEVRPEGKKCPACGQVAVTSSAECMFCGADYLVKEAASVAAK